MSSIHVCIHDHRKIVAAYVKTGKKYEATSLFFVLMHQFKWFY